jgi:hypothetical protein
MVFREARMNFARTNEPLGSEEHRSARSFLIRKPVIEPIVIAIYRPICSARIRQFDAISQQERQRLNKVIVELAHQQKLSRSWK